MKALVDFYFTAARFAIACLLGCMVVLVFGNVVLRYAFNQGITVSEELSRIFFIWLTFLGAVVAMRDHAHLGVDSLVRRLSPTGARIALVAGSVVFLAIGFAGIPLAGTFLAYPDGFAKPLILVIEAASMVSIAVTLGLLVLGAPERSGAP